MTDKSIVGRFGSGREVRRIEDAELLVGAGRLVDDVSLPSQAYVRFLRSPHAHARIVSIDAQAAKAMPGVITVLTGADLAAAGVKRIPLAPMFHRPDGSPGASPLRPALAEDTVRFVGEGIAASIAETVDQAKDALEAIAVEYEELLARERQRSALSGHCSRCGQNIAKAGLRSFEAAAPDGRCAQRAVIPGRRRAGRCISS